MTNARLASIRRLLGRKDALIAKRARHMKVLELLFAPAAERGTTRAQSAPSLAKPARRAATTQQRAHPAVPIARSTTIRENTAPWRVAHVWCQRLLWHQALQIVPPASKTTIGTIGNVKDGARASSARRELTVRILATASSRRSLSRKGTFVFLRRRSMCTSATRSKITRNNAPEGA